MQRINTVILVLIIIGPIVLFPVLGDEPSAYMMACFLYGVALAVGKTVIDDLHLDD